MKNAKVLFIDDRYEINIGYISKFEDQGAIVTYANSVAEAIRLLDAQNFDVVIIDLHMDVPVELPSQYFALLDDFRQIDKKKQVMNAGQIVGLFINDFLQEKPIFFYLSAVQNYYTSIDGAEPWGRNLCYDKFDFGPNEMLNVAEDALRKKRGSKNG